MKCQKEVLIISCFLLSVFSCHAQSNDSIEIRQARAILRDLPDNSLFVEFFGHAMLIGSFNSETVLLHKKRFYITDRLGLGFKPGQYKTISIPVLVNGIYQVTSAFAVECGLGASITYSYWAGWDEFFSISPSGIVSKHHSSGTLFDPLITGMAGIRIQTARGFLFRFSFTPVLNTKPITADLLEYGIIPKKIAYWFGISLGYSFR